MSELSEFRGDALEWFQGPEEEEEEQVSSPLPPVREQNRQSVPEPTVGMKTKTEGEQEENEPSPIERSEPGEVEEVPVGQLGDEEDENPPTKKRLDRHEERISALEEDLQDRMNKEASFLTGNKDARKGA